MNEALLLWTVERTVCAITIASGYTMIVLSQYLLWDFPASAAIDVEENSLRSIKYPSPVIDP